MKNKILFFGVLFLAIVQISTATVWRVNNRPQASAHFITLQAAHDSSYVLNGDTLYLEGSPDSYGNLTCTKQLHLIGAGDFLNEHDSTQAYKEVSIVGHLTFNGGSEFSIVEGLRFNNTQVNINTSYITIRRNRFHTVSNQSWITFSGVVIGDNCSNILIENNWIYMHGTNTYTANRGIYSDGANLSDLVIRNNYIHARVNSYYVSSCYCIALLSTALDDDVIITQNVFDAGIVYPRETQFFNNVMISGTFSPNGSYFNNNIGNNTQFGDQNGNQQNVDMSTVFVNHTSGIDSDMQLATGSPAIGAGLFGEDCGMYGADHPYKISCMPAIPAIWEVELNHYGNNATPINITVKAKAHN